MAAPFRIFRRGERVKQSSLIPGAEPSLLEPEYWIHGTVIVATDKRAYVDFSESVNLPSYRQWIDHRYLQEDK